MFTKQSAETAPYVHNIVFDRFDMETSSACKVQLTDDDELPDHTTYPIPFRSGCLHLLKEGDGGSLCHASCIPSVQLSFFLAASVGSRHLHQVLSNDKVIDYEAGASM
nr:hypothetical protein CFP56_38887 [Quercus suber]